MSLLAKSLINQESSSFAAGQRAGTDLCTDFGDHKIQAVVVYATINHDQPELLRGLRSVIGEDPIVVGCSVQGMTGPGLVIEQGYAAGCMAIGGDAIEASAAIAQEIQTDTREKGASLASELNKDLSTSPRVVVVLWDPLTGVDVPDLVEGLNLGVDVPIVGGAASQPWGPMVQTFQYLNGEVTSGSAVALALAGPFEATWANSHGSTPAGIEMTVTKADGNRLLELDGQPALDIWVDMVGGNTANSVDDTAAWAIGVEVRSVVDDGTEWSVLAAFGFDEDEKAVVLQSSIPVGFKIMFHHRTVEAVLEGTKIMGEKLRESLRGKTVRAVLGFECGARTSPFLGPDATIEENSNLQECVAPDASWLGMLAWGELAPTDAGSKFCNYTYPVMVLCDA